MTEAWPFNHPRNAWTTWICGFDRVYSAEGWTWSILVYSYHFSLSKLICLLVIFGISFKKIQTKKKKGVASSLCFLEIWSFFNRIGSIIFTKWCQYFLIWSIIWRILSIPGSTSTQISRSCYYSVHKCYQAGSNIPPSSRSTLPDMKFSFNRMRGTFLGRSKLGSWKNPHLYPQLGLNFQQKWRIVPLPPIWRRI